ncbi:MAG: xanthine dehydrogenase family protein molybdopterin-binding subunit [Proteobacteria bacterium]|nr:xanthine dehydrogenase family protein molybdopterin-binding subunit [Pseudomonadota bacterium]
MLARQTNPELSRRNFLVAGAAAGGGMMIGWVPAAEAGVDKSPPVVPDAYIRIDGQGKVTIVSPMIEMGQGTYTSLPMLVAEELDVDMANVSVAISPPSDKLYGNPALGNIQVTGGSTSIRGFYLPLRKTGAAARVMLIAAAAETWGIDPATLRTEPGFVVDDSAKRRLSYGELADRAAKIPVPSEVKLKDASQFRIIGTPAKRLDVSGKVNGSAQYGIDTKVPNMKVATVSASPVFGGKLVSFDEAAAKKIPGVVQVVKLDNALAVVGDHYWAAKKGLEAASPVFDDGPHGNVSNTDVVAALARAAERPGAVAKSDGNFATAFSSANEKVEATYEAPFLAHATMEPMNCTVAVTGDGCDIWVGTQIPVWAQQAVAKVLNLKTEQVRLHNHLLGGGFGRRLESDGIVQAALIAKQLDFPVKVVWSREEDIQHDMYRPYYYDRFSAGLDAQGMPVAWSHRIVGSSILARWAPPLFKNGIDPDAIDGAADMPYAIENFHVEYVREEPPGIPTAFWRGVGPTHNVYVIESFIDELAAAAKKDPVEYRRALLQKNPRALHVLDRAAELSNWGKPLGPRQGRGVSVQQAFGTYMCQVAEVTVSKDGEVKVDRVYVVVDPGVVVNPNTVVAQMQSGVIFGITAVLWGEITLDKGRVQQTNFDDYRILRIDEAPKIEVEIVKSSADPGGIGEPGTSGLAPAVLNAVYAATGVRLRKTPIDSKRLKAV